MGLLLSVLVTCLAVIEAIAVGRRVGLCCIGYERINPEFSEYTRNLREELKRAELVEEESDEDDEDLKSWSTFQRNFREKPVSGFTNDVTNRINIGETGFKNDNGACNRDEYTETKTNIRSLNEEKNTGTKTRNLNKESVSNGVKNTINRDSEQPGVKDDIGTSKKQEHNEIKKNTRTSNREEKTWNENNTRTSNREEDTWIKNKAEISNGGENTWTKNNETDTNTRTSNVGKNTENLEEDEDIQKKEAFWMIYNGENSKAVEKEHFYCCQCDESLIGQHYVLRDEQPYCIKCYESVFANSCEECKKIIGIDSRDLSYKDKHWHEHCFLCAKCRVSLVDKPFGSKFEKIYCGDCYDVQFASRCVGCGEIFRIGTKRMEYKTRKWHEECFCCRVCKIAIGTNSFIPRDQEIYCTGCYEDKFATKCVKCHKIITSGGVVYKNQPCHRDCFTCAHCNSPLSGRRFTSREDKPYCAECFGELFAKRCTSCSKPITGIGSTRFISFENRHWHNDCFVCAFCKSSLVGRGFITDGADILCPDCAKNKL